jgi:predicted transport protein
VVVAQAAALARRPENSISASRRGFLKALGIGATSAVTPPGGGAPAPRGIEVAPVTILPESRVAGAEFRLDVSERLMLQPGMRLTFRREPDNRFDRRAIAIDLMGDGGERRHIGYVPRHENGTIGELLDAGHAVAGELLPTERFTLHNRLRPGEEPDPSMRFIEEVRRDEDGGRIIKVECVRPQFRAWIATGQIAEAKPPDPREVPGEPGWLRIVPAHQARRLNYDTFFTNPVIWTVGMELALREQWSRWPGDGMFDLLTLEGRVVGELEGPHHVDVHQALAEGRTCRVIVTAIGKQKWSGGAPPSPCPIIEVRASKALTLPEDYDDGGPFENEEAQDVDPPDQDPPDQDPPDEPDAGDPRPQDTSPPDAHPEPESQPRMTDIRLFRTTPEGVSEIGGTTDTIERSLQATFEKNLETLLGVRFLATEFAIDGGRIDTLGLDENDAPVILEFKRSANENIINQGLFYLDWLVTHRKDFLWLVLEKLGKEAAGRVDWTSPRLICVAGDFSRYDAHAIKQITRHIELIRYRRYGADLLMLEKVASTANAAAPRRAAEPPAPAADEVQRPASGQNYKLISQTLDELQPGMRDRYEALRAHLMALGDDVEEVTTRFYIAFRRIKNFACVEFKPRDGRIMLFLKLDPASVATEPKFTRDVSKIGHFGTGDLEITLSNAEDLERAKPLIARSYAAV